MPVVPLKVKTMNAATSVDIDVNTEWDVSVLKEKISAQLPGNPAKENMRLIHQGRVMRDGTPVSDYPVQDNQFLHLVVREEAPAAPAASSSAAGAAAPQAAEQQQQQPHFHQPQVHTFTTQGSGTDLAGALSGLMGSMGRSLAGAGAVPLGATAVPQPQAAVPTPTPAAASSGIVQGIHVVVHATPTELESLPERLATFRREIQGMREGEGPPVSVVGDAPAPSPAPAAAPAAAAAPTPAPAAAPRTTTTTTTTTIPISNVMEGIGGGIESMLGPIMQQVGQSMQAAQRQAAAPAAPAPAPTPTPTPSSEPLFDVILKQALTVLQLPDLMALAMSGDTSPLDKVEPVAARHINEALAAPGASRGGLATEGAREATQILFVRNSDAAAALLRCTGTQRDAALSEAESIFERHLRRVIDVTVDPSLRAGQRYHEALRGEAGSLVGHLIDRLGRRCANGPEDVKVILHYGIKEQAGRYAAMLPPALAAMAPALLPAAVRMAQEWVKKRHDLYVRGGTADADSTALGFVPLAQFTPATPVDSTSTAGVPTDLLDEALSALPPPPTAPLSANYQAGNP